MKNFKLWILVIVGISAFAVGCWDYPIVPNGGSGTGEEETPAPEFISNVIEGRYIVVLNEDNTLRGNESAVRSMAESLVRSVGGEVASIEYVYAYSILGFSCALDPIMVDALNRDDHVKYVEQDQMMTVAQFDANKKPDTPGGGKGGDGGGEDPAPQTTPNGITRHGTGDGSEKRAWIIDSGIDMDHPDLNVSATSHNGGSGLSRSFLGGKDRDNPDDANGHGTHVAGTVAAIDNNQGVIGVAAGAEVVAVRVLDRRGSGSYSGVIAGVDYVAANASSADAANMSLGGGYSQAMNDAVIAASASCPFAIAAGNSSASATGASPASANGANIYTVSAMTYTGYWASFSNYGNPPIDYCATGVSVNSTYKNGGYTSLHGTSMAAPHVCGILLFGTINTDGTVINDPDQIDDPIAVK